MGFSRFISDNEEDEYRRGLGEEDPNKDWAWLVSAMRKPEEAIAPASTDPRQPRSGGGGIDAFTSARDAAGGDAPKGEGDTGTVSPTAKRIQIAQWGTEDPDEDRVTPESIGQNTKMLSSTDNTAPTKPPGPDSPAPNYKDPASSFLEASGYAARKKAYDQDWDPSGKWKGGFKIETTQQRMARREMQQRDVMEAEQEGLRMYDRFLGGKPTALGVQTFRTADGKKQVYAINNDGTSKLVMEALDDLAEGRGRGEYEGSPLLGRDGQYGRVRRGSNVIDRMMTPHPGAPLASSTGDPTLQGPGTPTAMSPWLSHEDKPIKVGYGQRVIDPETGEVIAKGGDRPVAAKGGGGGTATPKSPEAALEAEAASYAEKTVDARLKTDKRYNAMKSDSAKLAYENGQKALVKQEYIRRRTGGGAPAAPPRVSINKPTGPPTGAR